MPQNHKAIGQQISGERLLQTRLARTEGGANFGKRRQIRVDGKRPDRCKASEDDRDQIAVFSRVGFGHQTI